MSSINIIGLANIGDHTRMRYGRNKISIEEIYPLMNFFLEWGVDLTQKGIS